MRQLLVAHNIGQHCFQITVSGGKSHIDARLPEYNRSANAVPFIIVRDLDKDADCAPALLRTYPAPGAFLSYIIAVPEIESWLIADRNEFSLFLHANLPALPHDIDSILDAKRTVIDTARRSRSRIIRSGIIPQDEFTTQGPEYNSILIQFILTRWDYVRARQSSASLEHAVKVIAALQNALST